MWPVVIWKQNAIYYIGGLTSYPFCREFCVDHCPLWLTLGSMYPSSSGEDWTSDNECQGRSGKGIIYFFISINNNKNRTESIMPAQRKWEQKIEILIFEPKIWITLFNVWVRHSFNWTVFFQSFLQSWMSFSQTKWWGFASLSSTPSTWMVVWNRRYLRRHKSVTAAKVLSGFLDLMWTVIESLP